MRGSQPGRLVCGKTFTDARTICAMVVHAFAQQRESLGSRQESALSSGVHNVELNIMHAVQRTENRWPSSGR